MGRTVIAYHEPPDHVDIGAGLIARTPVGTKWEPDGVDDDPPYKVEIWADYDPDAGRFTPTEMFVERIDGGPPVTSRGIPIAAMVREISRRAVSARAIDATEVKLGFELPDHKLPRSLDDQAWRDIAVVYRTADAFGHRAGQSLADHYGVSRSTAAKWIREVKARGLLDPIMADDIAHRLVTAGGDRPSISIADLAAETRT